MTRVDLTLNEGSSSSKVALCPETGTTLLASGLADRIGPEGVLTRKNAADVPLRRRTT